MSGRNMPTFEEMQRYVEDRIGRALIPSDDLSTHYSIVDNLHTFTWEVRNNGQIIGSENIEKAVLNPFEETSHIPRIDNDSLSVLNNSVESMNNPEGSSDANTQSNNSSTDAASSDPQEETQESESSQDDNASGKDEEKSDGQPIIPERRELTDKELISICNFNNLRLECADIVEKSGRFGETAKYRTMYELIEGAETLFYELENEGDPKSRKIPIYKSKTDLKYYSGIAYEYFEKFNLGNEEGSFLNEWDLMYAGDGNDIVTNHIKFLYGKNEDDDKYEYVIQTTLNEFLSGIVESNVEKESILAMVTAQIPVTNENTTKFEQLGEYVTMLTITKPIEEDSLEIIETCSGKEMYFTDEIKNIMLNLLTRKITAEKVDDEIKFKTKREIQDEIMKVGKREFYASLTGALITLFFGIRGGIKLANTINSPPKLVKLANSKYRFDMEGVRSIYMDVSFGKDRVDAINELFLKKDIKGALNQLFTDQIKFDDWLLNLDIIDYNYALNNELSTNIRNLRNIRNAVTNLFGAKNLFGLSIRRITKNPRIFKAFLKTTIANKSKEILKDIIKETAECLGATGLNLVDIHNRTIAFPQMEELFQEAAKEIIEKLEKGSISDQKELLRIINSNYGIINNIIYEELYDSFQKMTVAEIIAAYPQIKDQSQIAQLIFAVEDMLGNLRVNNEIFSGLSEYPLDYFDFKTSIFVNKSIQTIVICFSDKGPFDIMKKDMDSGNYLNIFLLFEIILKNIIPNLYLDNKRLKLEEYAIHVTGSGLGAELATIFHLATSQNTTVFRTERTNHAHAVRTFNNTTISKLFKVDYSTSSEMLKEAAGSFLELSRTAFFLGVVPSILTANLKLAGAASILSSAGGALSIVTSTLSSTIVAPILILTATYLYKYIELRSDRKYSNYFYVQLCEMGYIDCDICDENEVEKTIKNCIHLSDDDDIKAPPLKTEINEKEILNKIYPIKFPGSTEITHNSSGIKAVESTSEKLTENTVDISGHTILLIITELYNFTKRIHRFEELFMTPDKSTLKGGIMNQTIITQAYYDDSQRIGNKEDTMEKYFEDLKIVEEYDSEIYNGCLSYSKEKFNEEKLGHYINSMSCILSKVTYLHLEESNGIHELRKKIFYHCLFTTSGTLDDEKAFYSNTYDDPSLGGLKSITQTIIDTSRRIQMQQDVISEASKGYTVFACGIPDPKTNQWYGWVLYVYAKNTLLTNSETRNLIVSTSRGIRDNIEYEVYHEWNNRNNIESLMKGYSGIGAEFIFFPCLDDKGMITNRDLFRDLRK